MPNVKLLEAANLVRQLDQAPPSRTLPAPLRACFLLRPAIALAALPPTPPSQRHLPAGRLLLPAAMPGDCPHQPTLAPARNRSLAAAAQPHSARAPHGRPRQAYPRRSPSRPRGSAPRPLRKNRRVDRKTWLCHRTGSHQRPRFAMGMPGRNFLRSHHRPVSGQHSASHPRSLSDAAPQLRCAPPTPSTSPSENGSTTPPSMPSKKFSLAALSPALPDAKVSPANSSSCANCHAPPTWNSAPCTTSPKWPALPPATPPD